MDYLIDFLLLAFLYAVCFFGGWRKAGRAVLLVNTTLYVYLAFVLYFTLMPILTSLPYWFDHPYVPMNLEPFIDVTLSRGDYMRQIVLNTLMTVPFGFLVPLTRMKKWRFPKTMLLCFLFSLGIELLQPLLSSLRSSDITDLITNVSGGFIGYLIYLLCRPMTKKAMQRLKN